MRALIDQVQKLSSQVAAQDARIRQMEAERGIAAPAATVPVAPVAAPVEAAAVATPPERTLDSGAHDHMVQLPGGGPALRIRGFYDFNLGMGSDSNPPIEGPV